MRKILGPLGATLAVALVMAAAAVTAGAMHSGSKGCAIKESCATGGLGTAVASAPAAVASAPAASGVAGPAPGRMAIDPDGLEGIRLPLGDTGSVAPGTVHTSNAPEFGFDVSAQAASVRFPYLRYPPFPNL
jgi:hypothetical protein